MVIKLINRVVACGAACANNAKYHHPNTATSSAHQHINTSSLHAATATQTYLPENRSPPLHRQRYALKCKPPRTSQRHPHIHVVPPPWLQPCMPPSSPRVCVWRCCRLLEGCLEGPGALRVEDRSLQQRHWERLRQGVEDRNTWKIKGGVAEGCGRARGARVVGDEECLCGSCVCEESIICTNNTINNSNKMYAASHCMHTFLHFCNCFRLQHHTVRHHRGKLQPPTC